MKRRSSTEKRGLAARVLGAFAVAVIGVGAAALLCSRPANAELENSIYTSKSDRIRIVVPRGWRATDQPSYPGLLLWMMRSEPEGRIVLTSEPFTRDVYCSWPVRCQMSHDSLPAKVACALGSKLASQRMRVGPVQAGPKETEDAGLPSVWFEYDDGHTFLRQAMAIDADHVVSLVLSAPTAEARNAHVRSFDQALRTLRPLTDEEMGISAPAGTGSAVVQAGSAARAAQTGSAVARTATAAQTGSTSAGSASAGSASAGSASAGSASAGSATIPGDAGVDAAVAPSTTPTYVSAPARRIDPIGPCPRK